MSTATLEQVIDAAFADTWKHHATFTEYLKKLKDGGVDDAVLDDHSAPETQIHDQRYWEFIGALHILGTLLEQAGIITGPRPNPLYYADSKKVVELLTRWGVANGKITEEEAKGR